MNGHEKAQQARIFVRAYVEENGGLIQNWLDGSGSTEDVGAELIRLVVEDCIINGVVELGGIQGLYIEALFRKMPGGESAARRLLAELIASGKCVPQQLQKLCSELLREGVIEGGLSDNPLRPGPKERTGRRDALIWILLRVLQANFDLPIRSNDARAEDPDVPDAGLDIIQDELSLVEPGLLAVNVKTLHGAVKRFEANHRWFAQQPCAS